MAFNGRIAFFFVFLFFQNTYADKCSAVCTGATNPKGGFLQGSTYNYVLEGNAYIELIGAVDKANVNLVAHATVYGLGNCANILKITGVKITDTHGKQHDVPMQITKPVRFTLQDGVVGSDICVEADETRPSLNIKRAILSLLQTANKHNTEVDVFGVCPTYFDVKSEGSRTVVTKTRNLNSCIHREQGKHDLLSIINPKTEKQSNILDSRLNVETLLTNGIVEKSKSIEEYVYAPFTVDSSGAKAYVDSKLTLKNVNKGAAIQTSCVIPKSIIFENPFPVKTEQSNIPSIQLALQKTIQMLGKYADSKSASSFAALVRTFRYSNKDDLMSVYKQIKGGSTVQDNSLQRKVFLDALFRAGTGDSIEVSINLIKNEELNKLEQTVGLIAMVTVLHASTESVEAATGLLDIKGLPNEVYLAVGALAGAYCRDHPCHGAKSQDRAIAKLSEKLNAKLGNCMANDKQSENVIMFALKSIKSIHHIEPCLEMNLANCASDKNVKQRVRVAALEAYAADACIPKLQKVAMDILKDARQDSEVRIKAYLALVKCPNAQVAQHIKNVLETEKINQVGSFITSSLKNIRASVNPAYENAKQFFGGIPTTKHFPIDVRKYSQNYEMSYEHGMFGVGSFAEADVIYSQNSFLPRSSNLNLTTDIFGRNVNLLEVGFRQGNLDRFVEKYFGPHGVFKTESPQSIYREGKDKIMSIFEKIRERMEHARGKRSVLEQTHKLGKNMKTDVAGYHDDLDLDIFVKIFGSDALFLSLGDDKPTSIESLIDKFFDCLADGVTQAKDFSHEIRSHMLLFDLESGYPTALGVALKLTLEGASTTRMQFSSNIDIQKILSEPNNVKIDFSVVPSANVELSGMLMFDADVVSTGLKVSSSLHTSTGAHVTAKVNNGKFDMDIKLPVEKQELVSVKHELLYVNRKKGQEDSEKEVQFREAPERYQFKGCFDQVRDVTGLSFCGDVSVPKVVFMDENQSIRFKASGSGLLSGPGRFVIFLEKNDLRGFHISSSVLDKPEHKSFELIFEAQGSVTRKTMFTIDLINQDHLNSLKVSLVSPIKKSEGTLVYVSNNKELSLTAKLIDDGDDVYGKIGMLISGGGNREIMTPILEFKLPGQDKNSVQMTGTIIRETGKKMRLTFKDLSLKSSSVSLKLNGYGELDTENYRIENDIQLTCDQEMFTMKGKMQAKESNYNVDMSFLRSMDTNTNFRVIANLDKKDTGGVVSFSLVHGPDFNSKQNLITYKGELIVNDYESAETMDFYVASNLEYPLLKLKYDSKVKVNPKEFRINTIVATMAASGVFKVNFERGMKHANDATGTFEIKIDQNGVVGESSFKVDGPMGGTFQISAKTVRSDGRKATELKSSTQYDFNTNTVFKFDGSLITESSNKPYKTFFEYISKPKLFTVRIINSDPEKERLNFGVKYQKDVNIGNVQLQIKDYIMGQSQFKYFSDDCKGEAEISVKLLKFNKDYKFDTAFALGGPQYNAHVNFFYDLPKDSNKKVSISTNTKYQNEVIDSKNSFIFGNEKVDFTIKGEFPGEWMNGKQNALMTLAHSGGKSVSLKLDREWAMEETTKHKGQGEVLLTYTPGKGEKPYKSILKCKVNTQNAMDIEHVYTFVKPTGEEFNYKMTYKTSKKGPSELIVATADIQGALAPNTINFYASEDRQTGKTDYRYKGSYGPKTSFELFGTYMIESGEGKDHKFVNDFDLTLAIPLEKTNNIKITNKYLMFVPNDQSFVQVKFLLASQINADTYKYTGEVKMGETEGNGELMIHVPNYEKFTTKGKYTRTLKGEERTYDTNLEVEYSGDQKFIMTVNGKRTPQKDGHFVTDISLPSKVTQAQKIHMDTKFKVPKSNAMIWSNIVDVDGKRYELTSNVDMFDVKLPMIEFYGKCADAKPYKFFVKADLTDETEVKYETKIENFGAFNLDMNVLGKVQSAEEFRIRAYIDCETLKLNKIQFEAVNEALSKGVKKIQITATENGKNLMSGSTTYQIRKEGNKFTMEGSGSVALRDQQKSTSFKFIKDELSEGNEKGMEIFFNVALGEKTVAIEFKKTNLMYKFSNAYCEEMKQCAHINIYSKVEDNMPDRYIRESEISIDLRKLGFKSEFGLQTKSELLPFQLPTYTFDIHVNSDKSKYHSQVYAKRVGGDYKTALTVTMPHRTVSLESSTTYPDVKNKQPIFPMVHETCFYTNKADPKTKTSFKARIGRKDNTGDWSIVFSNPSLEKDMEMSGKTKFDKATLATDVNVVIDIFKKKQQKIVFTAQFTPTYKTDYLECVSKVHLNAKELGFDYLIDEKLVAMPSQVTYNCRGSFMVENKQKQATISMNLKKDKQTLKIKLPTTELLDFENDITADKNSLSYNTRVCILQDKTYTSSGAARMEPSYQLEFKVGGGQAGVLSVRAMADSQKKISEVSAEAIQGKTTMPLFKYGVKLEKNKIKPTTEMSNEHIQEYTKMVAEEVKSLIQHVENCNKVAQEDLLSDVQSTIKHLQNNMPDFSRISKFMSEEFQRISDELKKEKAVQDFLHIFDVAIETTMDIFNKFMEVYGKTMEMVTDICNKFVSVFNEKILPDLSNFFSNVLTEVSKLMEIIVDSATHYFGLFSGFMDKFITELTPLIETCESIVSDAMKVMTKLFNEALKPFEDIIKQLADMPNQILGSNYDEVIIMALTEVVTGCNQFIQTIIPNEEVRAFFELLTDYIVKKIKSEPCDDTTELNRIAEYYMKAFDSVSKSRLNIDIPDMSYFLPLVVPSTVYTNWKFGAPSWSAYNYISKETQPSRAELFLAYRPNSLNPIEYVPPYKLRAYIVDGQHIFTYDGRHMTFPGDCKYVLSQDAVDGNFSIVMHMSKGKPKSVFMIDKSGTEVEVNEKMQLNLNGKAHGFPLVKADTQAWKEEDHTFSIQTNYGARVQCSSNLDLCKVTVSGFYLGKLRGLLGDGNHEPFDDYKMPNGNLAKSEAEFGHSYALASNCPKVKTVDHSHHHHKVGSESSICNTLFGEDSDVYHCKAIVNINNYKQACQHATAGMNAAKAMKEACSIVRAYTLACRSEFFPVFLPDICAKCNVDGETYNVDQSFQVKTPTKKVDIILAVETTKENSKTFKEMILPLFSTMIDELKSKHITDVKVHLIGITPKMKYPIYYDINNNKLSGNKVEFIDHSRTSAWETVIVTGNETLDDALNKATELLQSLELSLGLNNIHMTYAKIGKMELRPKAMKTIIMVHSHECVIADYPIIQWFASGISEQLMVDEGLVAHLITPVSELKLRSQNVVGFSENQVFVLGDKKRGMSNANLRSELSYNENDACFDHALETYGNIYSSTNFFSTPANARKGFLTMISNTIVDSLVDIQLESECTCEGGIFKIDPKVSCEVTTRKDNRKTPSKKK